MDHFVEYQILNCRARSYKVLETDKKVAEALTALLWQFTGHIPKCISGRKAFQSSS